MLTNRVMTELDDRCLDTFPVWLKALPSDVLKVAEALEHGELPIAARTSLASAVNYLFKSLDLIPDGIEDLGMMDDAFVLRCAVAAARDQGVELEALAGLVQDNELVREFLGDDYARFERYVGGLSEAVVRGRTAEQVVSDAAARTGLLEELRRWAAGYEAPGFGRDEKNLVKLKSFLRTKLPS